jgi:transposase
MRQEITLNEEKQRRARVLMDLGEDRLTLAEAAESLGISQRQVRRLRERVKAEGVGGLLHGNAGRVPANKCAAELRNQALALWHEKYSPCNQVQFADLLARDEGLDLSRSTLRRWLAEEGIGAPRPQVRSRHRRHRLRRAQQGALIQVDASTHPWFGDAGPPCTIVGGVDDATNRVWGVIRPGEDTVGYMELLARIVAQHGIPTALYADRTTVLLGAKRSPDRVATSRVHYDTQVTRVLRRLDIHLIQARSPQAKGRIERVWRTLQDRFVTELRINNVTTLPGAQALLDRHLAFHNRNYGVAPRDETPAWRALAPGARLEDVICWEYSRRVSNANTVSVDGLLLQLELEPGDPGWDRRTVRVSRRLDGSWFASFLGRSVPATPIARPHRRSAAA